MINKQGISYLSTNAKSCETGHVKVQNFEKKAVTGATSPELPELLKKVKRQKKGNHTCYLHLLSIGISCKILRKLEEVIKELKALEQFCL